MTWQDRQSFLGEDSERRLAEAVVGIVGLGGGNSHVVQQLAHVGIGNFVLIDEDVISITNMNRLIAGTRKDVTEETAKTEIMRRMILAINPEANIQTCQSIWQLASDALKPCDLVIGGLDKIRAKDELDSFCRRFLIPYIDQGMDVHKLGDRDFLISGQVMLSAPGGPCLRCLGIVTEQALEEEARAYGDAGGKPQVVWPNGVLASSAVGIAISLLTPWYGQTPLSRYLTYDGNTGVMVEGDRLRKWGSKTCAHHEDRQVGDPTFDIRNMVAEGISDTKAEMTRTAVTSTSRSKTDNDTRSLLTRLFSWRPWRLRPK
ncbi:ThiF family adenylyltransferase [Rhizobium johnstonii]|uniref:HesA/MoeB/ThiF family protein n=1 Tax=Rhizobium johnstonii TaxID=3019933 RepID=UPI003F9B4D66